MRHQSLKYLTRFRKSALYIDGTRAWSRPLVEVHPWAEVEVVV